MIRAQGLEIAAGRKILKTTTANPGTDWVKLGNANADQTGIPYLSNQIGVYNNTGTELSFGYGASDGTAPVGETFELPSGASYGFRGMSSTAQLFVRRTDLSNTQVTFKAIAETV